MTVEEFGFYRVFRSLGSEGSRTPLEDSEQECGIKLVFRKDFSSNNVQNDV